MAVSVPLQRIRQSRGRQLAVLRDEQKVPDELDRTLDVGFPVVSGGAFLKSPPAPQGIPELPVAVGCLQDKIDSIGLETNANVHSWVMHSGCVRAHHVGIHR